MTEKTQHHDFIEINYTGKLTDGKVFDTTLQEVAKGVGLPLEKTKFGPMVVCIGEHQLLPGLDKELENRIVGEKFTVNLNAEDAFGKKDVKNLKIVPISSFREQNVQPRIGLQLEIDNKVGTVMRISGGRIIVNFNHPLAGREVVYDVEIIRKITDSKDQLKSFLNSAMKIPEDKIQVGVNEGVAEVTLPLQLPEQFTLDIGKKLAEITKLKDVKFLAPKSKE